MVWNDKIKTKNSKNIRKKQVKNEHYIQKILIIKRIFLIIRPAKVQIINN